MAARFEPVKRFADASLPIPTRATANSAGYDLTVAEDIIVPSYLKQVLKMSSYAVDFPIPFSLSNIYCQGHKPTLVSTGMKCKLDPGTYLEITVRSSTPLKYWLILANGKGIIDSDYYSNDQNDGEIFLQLINLSPFDIKLQKGDRIGQAIIHSYLTTEDDTASGERTGGFGSSG